MASSSHRNTFSLPVPLLAPKRQRSTGHMLATIKNQIKYRTLQKYPSTTFPVANRRRVVHRTEDSQTSCPLPCSRKKSVAHQQLDAPVSMYFLPGSMPLVYCFAAVAARALASAFKYSALALSLARSRAISSLSVQASVSVIVSVDNSWNDSAKRSLDCCGKGLRSSSVYASHAAVSRWNRRSSILARNSLSPAMSG